VSSGCETAAHGRRIEVRGTVQGVGFRPFVWRVAHERGLTGAVWNHPGGVTIEAWGDDERLDRLLVDLRTRGPRSARVDSLRWRDLEDSSSPTTFEIVDSARDAEIRAEIPADLAPCDACLRELRDPDDRRFRYPFINCTDCGPRFTLALRVPWDRPATTMAGFPLCDDCAREYADPADRRFHAEPLACPACGPRLRLVDASGDDVGGGDPIRTAAQRLQRGAILAVHGVGGFHLACDAGDERAVAELRRRKHREEKPFAVMVGRLRDAARLAAFEAFEARMLSDPERPIVLLDRRPGAALAPSVAPGVARVGLMLPSSPLHHLLLDDVGRPLVMTSGNRVDEPTITDADAALSGLRGIADAFLVHDRPIASRCDDSVVASIAGRRTVLRRARGCVPRAVALARPVQQPVLAVGGQLKNAICVAVDDRAWLGPHIGDLDHPDALDAFARSIDRLEGFLGVQPEVVACDLHPDYASTRHARTLGRRVVPVQHHHAHAASCLAEHGHVGPALALCWDGTGLGPDATAWGGELLLVDGARMRRLATLRPLALAGGERAIREPWRLALAMVVDAGLQPAPDLFPSVRPERVDAVRGLLEHPGLTPLAHGAGRWFDAVGALLCDRPVAAFEGQVPMALEQACGRARAAALPWHLEPGAVTVADLRAAVRELVRQREAGRPRAELAAAFHATLADVAAVLVAGALAEHGPLPLALSGGCFANARLVDELLRALEPLDVDVLRHGDVPPGDGGLALGQAVVADLVLHGAEGSG
jgi:hydrogenase maturation protein HypF